MTAPPEPLVPADADVRRFDCLMFECQRLLDSSFMAWSTGDEFKAAAILWLKAWHQVPAGSIPDDDRVLAYWTGLAPEKWVALREHALHGFVLCNDARFYHPLICKKVCDALAIRESYRERSKKANDKRWKYKRKAKAPKGIPERSQNDPKGILIDPTLPDLSSSLRSEEKVPGLRPAQAKPCAAPPDDEIKQKGMTLLGYRRGGLIRQMRVRFGDERVREALAAVERRQPADPLAYFVSCCEHRNGGSDPTGPPAASAEPLPPPKPVNPKVLGHGDHCMCSNCERWAKEQVTHA